MVINKDIKVSCFLLFSRFLKAISFQRRATFSIQPLQELYSASSHLIRHMLNKVYNHKDISIIEAQ